MLPSDPFDDDDPDPNAQYSGDWENELLPYFRNCVKLAFDCEGIDGDICELGHSGCLVG